MKGIQFVVDDKGRQTAVVIDLKKHKLIWEDFFDGLMAESRQKEQSFSYEQYRNNRLNLNPELES